MNEINEKLSVLDDIKHECADTMQYCENKPDCKHQNRTKCHFKLDKIIPDYCNSIKAITKLAAKLGFKLYELHHYSEDVITMTYIYKGKSICRIVKVDIEGNYPEAYARAVGLLGCCVLEGLIDG